MVKQQGFLLVEALLAIAILMAVMMLIIPSVEDTQQTKATRQMQLSSLVLERTVRDQLTVQLNSIGRLGCLPHTDTIKVMDMSQEVPIKVTSGTESSDWLRASEVGVCASYGTQTEGSVTATMDCDGLKTGQKLLLSSCLATTTTSILSIRKKILTAYSTESLLEGDVLVATYQTFYWYIAPGKSGQLALWRKPADSGRAVELLPGLTNMRIYPILDTDQNGIADMLSTKNGEVSVHQLQGLLVEYRYQLADCDLNENATSQVFENLKGEQWRYNGVCSGIGKLLINLQGRS